MKNLRVILFVALVLFFFIEASLIYCNYSFGFSIDLIININVLAISLLALFFAVEISVRNYVQYLHRKMCEDVSQLYKALLYYDKNYLKLGYTAFKSIADHKMLAKYIDEFKRISNFKNNSKQKIEALELMIVIDTANELDKIIGEFELTYQLSLLNLEKALPITYTIINAIFEKLLVFTLPLKKDGLIIALRAIAEKYIKNKKNDDIGSFYFAGLKNEYIRILEVSEFEKVKKLYLDFLSLYLEAYEKIPEFRFLKIEKLENNLKKKIKKGKISAVLTLIKNNFTKATYSKLFNILEVVEKIAHKQTKAFKNIRND
jgi:signal transduction histidine kinase